MFARASPLLFILPAFLLAGCADGGTTSAACDEMKASSFSLAYPNDKVAFWETTMGCIAVELYTEKTPITAGNFVNLTQGKFYDGTRFHRVIDGFMIQDGDPNSKDIAKKVSWGQGGPGYTIKDEFPCKDGSVVVGSSGTGCSSKGGLLFTHDAEGVLSMANAGANTGGSQYFITLVPTPHLDGKHAIFGKVVGGMETVRDIGKTPTNERDQPLTDVVIQKLFLQDSSGPTSAVRTTSTTTGGNATSPSPSPTTSTSSSQQS